MMASGGIPAVFLDRDGTLIEDQGHLGCPSQVAFFPDTAAALRLLQRDFRLFIVTNQLGIAEGVVTAVQVDRVNDFVRARLARAGIRIEATYCCPHRRADGCGCIKPNPHFPREAAERFGLDLSTSFVVGDHPHDVELARRAGAVGIYVLTGHGAKHQGDLPVGTEVASGILEAALRIRELADGGPAKEVADAARLLRDGGVVAFPTETVYGLGAAATNRLAVARVFEIKGRPRFDPLIVHVSGPGQAAQVVRHWPPAAQELADRFWPGPLTLVLPRLPVVPDLVTAGLETVAVRMPDHPLALALIAAAGGPLAAPSANPFGGVSPTTADHVRAGLGDAVDRVLDGGPCRVGIESTILSLTGKRAVLLRPGGLPVEEIEAVIGPVERQPTARSHLTAPGQLPAHYAPRTPVILRSAGERLSVPPRTGLLSFRMPTNLDGFAAVEVISENGDVREAAARLFAALHLLDNLGLDLIIADAVPDSGLGLAINDRLRRAAAAREPSPGFRGANHFDAGAEGNEA